MQSCSGFARLAGGRVEAKDDDSRAGTLEGTSTGGRRHPVRPARRYSALAREAIRLGVKARIVGLGADKKRYPRGTAFESRAAGERAFAKLRAAIAAARRG
jgi:hypothetical protein